MNAECSDPTSDNEIKQTGVFIIRVPDPNRKVMYDREIPQSHSADQPTVPRGKAT